MRKMLCDLCGKEGPSGHFHQVHIKVENISRLRSETFDLCEDCYGKKVEPALRAAGLKLEAR